MAFIFHICKRYSTFDDVKADLDCYKKEHHSMKLIICDSMTIKQAKKRAPNKNISDDIMYNHITFSCHHGGRDYKLRPGSKRETFTNKVGCGFKLRFRMSKKILVAFDFDHTIIDENSDLYVRKLAPGGVIPKEIKDMYSNRGWTEYMAAIFKLLHENGTTPDQIIECMKEIKFVDGLKDLLKHLSSEQFQTIIISDSNSVFIDCIMKESGFNETIDKVYTNPAVFDSAGCLTIQYYHTQDWCDLSTKNLCKGHILEDYISQQAKQGIIYDTVAYVGDGSNDLCPALKLRNCDFLFPRIGFKLEQLVEENNHDLKCEVVMWESGKEILDVLKTLM